jgi:cytochrome-b5 reductase
MMRFIMKTVTRVKTQTPTPYKIMAIEVDTHDTKTFRFELPADATLDMLPGDFLYVHATLNGKTVKRPYTPSSLVGIAGFFDLTVKRYDAGSVSRYLHDQRIGDMVLMSGPNTGGHWSDGMAKRVGFVAGGTGITPMISIIRWILANKIDAELFLIYANKTEADIIFRQEWERNIRDHSNFHCHHVLEQPPPGWMGSTGRITPEILRHHLPAPASDTCLFLCGPPPMVDALETMLKELGYPEQAIILP